VIAQHVLRPSSDTCRVVKFANTPCPIRSVARVRGVVTVNWKTCPLVVTLAETMPVVVWIAVMEQHAAGVCAAAGAVASAIAAARENRYLMD
jgi:hypothetical protein